MLYLEQTAKKAKSDSGGFAGNRGETFKRFQYPVFKAILLNETSVQIKIAIVISKGSLCSALGLSWETARDISRLKAIVVLLDHADNWASTLMEEQECGVLPHDQIAFRALYECLLMYLH